MSLISFVFLTLLQALPLTRERVDQVKIDPDTRIEVDNINGEVEFIGWDKDFVEIRSLMTTERDSAEFGKVTLVVKEGDPLVIKTDYKVKNARLRVDYTIHVPARAGAVRASVVNGDIIASGVRVPVKLSTVNGGIDLQGGGGLVDVDCVNGDVKISGPAEIRKVSCVSGDIDVVINALNDMGVELSTVSGSIRAAVAPGLDADIELSTVSGKVSVHDLVLKDKEYEWNAIHGQLNEGGAPVSASSVSGSVRLIAAR